jgi:hypothetical protein
MQVKPQRVPLSARQIAALQPYFERVQLAAGMLVAQLHRNADGRYTIERGSQ